MKKARNNGPTQIKGGCLSGKCIEQSFQCGLRTFMLFQHAEACTPLIFCGKKDRKPCCCIPKLPHQHVQTFDAGNQGIKLSVRLRAKVFIPRPDSIFDCTCLNREMLELQLSKAYPPTKMHQLNGSGPLDLKTQRQSRATALRRNGPEAASRSSWLGEPGGGGGLTFLGGTKCNSNPATCRVCRSPSPRTFFVSQIVRLLAAMFCLCFKIFKQVSLAAEFFKGLCDNSKREKSKFLYWNPWILRL